MNPLTMTDQELIEHASKQVQALRMALDMIECEKYERRHVRWAIIDALKEEPAAPAQSCYCPNCEEMGKELAALKAQPAPVQPVAWRLWDDDPGQISRWQYYDKSDFKDGVNPMDVFPQLAPLYVTQPAAQPAPVIEGVKLMHQQIEAKLKKKNT